MGRTTRGTLRQKFRIKIDIENLRDLIAEQIEENLHSEDIQDVEIDEYYIDDTEIVIDGCYSTGYERWTCKGTLESPPEDEIERMYLNDNSKNDWMFVGLPEEIKKLIKVKEIEEDEDDVSYPYDDWD